MKSSFKILTLSVALLGLTASAHAVPTLSLWDGANLKTVSDNGADDADANAGSVVFVGSLGGASSWIINVSAGLTYPVIGSLANPEMHLSSVNVSIAPGTLTITFTADGFGPSAGTSDA